MTRVRRPGAAGAPCPRRASAIAASPSADARCANGIEEIQ